ncbi:MAG: hypothetical protein EG822_14770 [Deltaproteobacteria bacterium]|nr:hypothetical protein [Deltaproteobacteria bacterium]TLN02087.1 MAG: hypothetical protein FDZ73_13350 [bacterium]
MKLLHKIKHDFVEILPPTIFFFIAFSLVLLTKRLILSEYGISWTGFGSAIVGAILVGKVVLIVDKLTFTSKFSQRQLIFSTAWKSLIYFSAAVLLQYLESIIHLLMKHESFSEANRLFVTETVWPHFWLIQMWLAVLLFFYCTMRELIRAIGREKVVQLFFGATRA